MAISFRKEQRKPSQRKTKRNILVQTITTTLRFVGCTSETIGFTYWLSNIALILFILVTSLEVIALVVAKDAERRFECFSVFSFCGMGVLKLFSLRICKERWMNLLKQIVRIENQQMDNNDKLSGAYGSDSDTEIISDIETQQYSENFATISGVLFKIYGLTTGVYILFPFVEYMVQKIYMETCKEYLHILPIWAPLDSNILGYVGTILIELIAAIFCAYVHLAFDLSAVGFIIFCQGQLRLLRHCSENIAGDGKLCCISRDRDILGRYRIRKCHRLHIFIVNVIEELGRLLKDILGVYYLVAALTLCTVVVRLNTEVLTKMELIRLIQYLCGTLIQLFIFCYYGNAIVYECSVGMSEGPSGSAYWSLSPHVRGEIILLMIGMSIPLKLQAGPFHTLDLPSFTMILRAAYSYYAVLRQ